MVHYVDWFQDSGEKVSARLIWIYTICKGYMKVYRLLFTFSKFQMQRSGYAPWLWHLPQLAPLICSYMCSWGSADKWSNLIHKALRQRWLMSPSPIYRCVVETMKLNLWAVVHLRCPVTEHYYFTVPEMVFGLFRALNTRSPSKPWTQFSINRCWYLW